MLYALTHLDCSTVLVHVHLQQAGLFPSIEQLESFAFHLPQHSLAQIIVSSFGIIRIVRQWFSNWGTRVICDTLTKKL